MEIIIRKDYIKILDQDNFLYKNHETLTKYRNSFFDLLDTYDFDWFCTLNLKKSVIEDCEKDLKRWRFEMSVKEHIQIAYIGILVTSKFSGPHAHLLMTGSNQKGERLLHKDRSKWQRKWNDITHRGALIEIVNDSGVAEYISNKKNTPVNDFELLQPYNRRLLDKYRKLKNA